MKKLINIFSSNTTKFFETVISGDEKRQPQNESSNRDGILGNENEKADTRKILAEEDSEENSMVITYASKWLSEAINDILMETNTHRANNAQNLLNLITLLESKDIMSTEGIEDDAVSKIDRGMGCLEVLLVNILHSQLHVISISNKLASSLFQALRLLRIIEVLGASGDNTSYSPGITELSCKRLCSLFQHLCSDTQVLEELRPHIVKILCFPISSKQGFHIQYESMAVVSSISKHGLTWQIIWYLHDNRVVQLMLASLQDIMTDSSGTINTVCEEAELWLLGVQCIVDLVTASASVSGVLVQDFDASDGNAVLTKVAILSNKQRLSKIINLVMKLYVSAAKSADVSMPAFPIVIANLLDYIYSFNLQLNIVDSKISEKASDQIYNIVAGGASIIDLVTSCQRLFSSMSFSDVQVQMLSSVTLAMLSLYSEDPHLFKLSFSFRELILILLSLPAIQDRECFASALTVAVYVCQFHHSDEVDRVMLALCAVASFLVFQLFQLESASNECSSIFSLLTLISNSIASIARADTHCSVVILQNTIQFLIVNTLNQFQSRIKTNTCDEDFFIQLSNEILIILSACLAANTNETFEEILRSNLLTVVEYFVNCDVISSRLLRQILRIHISFSMAKNEKYITISIQLIVSAMKLKLSSKRFDDASALINTLTDILSSNQMAILVWDRLRLFSYVVEILSCFDAIMSERSKLQEFTSLDDDVRIFLGSALKCISVALSSVNVHSKQHRPVNSTRNRKYYKILGDALVRIGAFKANDDTSKSVVDLVLGVTDGVPLSLIANPGVVEVLFEVIEHMSKSVALYSLGLVSNYIRSDLQAKKRLCDVHLVSQIVEKFHYILFDEDNVLKNIFIDLITESCKDFMTVSDFISLFTYVVSKDLYRSVETTTATVKPLQPWIGQDNRLNDVSWTGLQLLLDLASSDSIHKAAPFVSFNSRTSIFSPIYSISDLALSLWLYIPTFELFKELPFFSILDEDLTEVIMSFTLDISKSSIIALSPKIKGSPFIFKVPIPIRPSSWHLVTLNFTKSILRARVQVGLAFDTAICDNSSPTEFEFKESSKPKRRYFVIGSQEAVANDDPVDKSIPLFELWRCGIIRLFAGTLSMKQVLHTYLKGPSYLGSFREDDPLHESPSVYSSIALLNMRHKNIVNANLLEVIGLSGIGLDLIADPTIDESKHAVGHVLDKLTFPPIEWMFSSNFKEMVQENSHTSEYFLKNGAVTNFDKSRRATAATVKECIYLSPYCNCVSSCISAFGGPSFIFPLLHAAILETHLLRTLDLLLICCKSDTKNLKYMQSEGYRVLSFLLSIKRGSCVTDSVLLKLLDLSILRYEEDRVHFCVFFDAVAFYHLIMNHQIYGLRYSFLFYVLNAVHDLVICPRYGFINCVRAASIGLFRWLLRLGSYVVQRSLQSNSEEWRFPETVDEEAAMRDIFVYLPSLTDYLLPYFSINIIVKIALQETKVSNLEPIQQISDAIFSSFSLPTQASSIKLTPSGLWRILLIRSLIEILKVISLSTDDSKIVPLRRAFINIINVKYLAVCFTRSTDEATMCQLMRLLSMVFEASPMLIRDFSSLDVFRMIPSNICSSLSFALPALGMLLRIPASLVPYAEEIFTQSAEMPLSENSIGPDFSDIVQASDYLLPTSIPDAFALPLLSQILECIRADRFEDRDRSQNDFIITTVYKSFGYFSHMRNLMVSKTVTDKLCCILTAYLVTTEIERSTVDYLNITFGKIKNLLLMISVESVFSKNPMIIPFIIERLPDIGYECIVEIFQYFRDKSDFDSIQAITAIFINLVPFYKSYAFGILRMIDSLEKMISVLNNLISILQKGGENDKSNQQKLEALVKDLSTVIRYLFECCLSRILQNESNDCTSINSILKLLFQSVEVLISKSGCEDSDDLILEKSTVSASSVSPTVFDMFTKATSAVDAAFKSTNMELARALSKFFCGFLVHVSVKVIQKYKDEDVQATMCRIISIVCLKKFGYCRKLFGPFINGESVDGGTQPDVFREGMLLLLPDRSAWNDFIQSVRNHDAVEEEEGKRMKLYSKWVLESANICLQIQTLESLFAKTFPCSVPFVKPALKRATASWNDTRPLRVNNGVMSESIIELECRSKEFDYLCNKWLSSGYSSLSSGALAWKTVWAVLVSGTIWGERLSELNAKLASIHQIPKRWKLDVLESPERSRVRLLQCIYDEVEGGRTISQSVDSVDDGMKGVEGLFARLLKEGVIKENEEEATHENATPTEPLEESDFEPAGTLSTDTQMNLSGDVYLRKELDVSSVSKENILLDIVKGIVGPLEWAQGKTANIERLCGMESYPALLIISSKRIHILRGFSVSRSSDTANPDRVINWEPTANSLLNSSVQIISPITSENMGKIIGNNSDLSGHNSWLHLLWKDLLYSEYAYYCMPLNSVYTIFKKRYELKLQALEISDTDGYSIIFSCNGVDRADKIIKVLLQHDMPNSVFSRTGPGNVISMLSGLVGNFYNTFLSYLLSQLTKMWLNNELTNFKYLMHLNAASGRSYHDLTQYPVFPWILADYTSPELDFENPSTFRDLSKPMGAIGLKRSEQYIERFESMALDFEQGVSESPPFHYGTHYSCAGYVLHYLVRLEPFSSMAIELQGGTFDKPDRLFKSIESCWRSAAGENFQDVRELIPEFFSLSAFLTNSNKFNLGITQSGDRINDVILPPWAKGDPDEFIRLNREALECRYVSEHLHEWIDLIFGSKQLGEESEHAMNVFIHMTYAGRVDIDAIVDPILRNAVISQINNFGQTPTRLFSKPHPRRIVTDLVKTSVNKEKINVDVNCLLQLDKCTPPLCVVGASEFSSLTRDLHTIALKDIPVGDICFFPRDRMVVVPLGCILVPPKFTKLLHFNSAPGRVSFHEVSNMNNKSIELDEELSSSMLHSRAITNGCFSSDGMLLATCGEDLTICLWDVNKVGNYRRLECRGVLVGHMATVTCIDLCDEYSLLVSGSFDQCVGFWDTKESKLIRMIGPLCCPIESVSVNRSSGGVVILLAVELRFYSINGGLLAVSDVSSGAFADNGCALLALPVADWQRGVVAVTGHEGGNVHLWRLHRAEASGSDCNPIRRVLYVSYTLPKSHKKDITTIKLCMTSGSSSISKYVVTSSYKNASAFQLYVGDLEGCVSRWSTIMLNELPLNDKNQILQTKM